MSIISAYAVPHPPLIVPEVGRGQEKGIQNTVDSYEKVGAMIANDKPDTIVIFSPHQTMYADYIHISPGSGANGDFSQFNAGKVKQHVEYDTEFVNAVCMYADLKDVPAGTLGERSKSLDHGTMVPLYFVNKYLKDYQIVRIGLSGLSFIKHYELGQCVKQAAEKLNRRTVIIASGDLSHKLKEDGPYGYIKEGPEYDRRVTDVLARGAFDELLTFDESFCDKAAECGHRSFIMMAGALDKTSVEPDLLSYEGPFGVGYGICSFKIRGADTGRNFSEQYEEKLSLKQRGSG